MDLNPICIAGHSDFWEEVNKKLSRSGLKFITGDFERSPDNNFIGHLWIDANTDLEELKKAVGEKVVDKWGLSFYKEGEQAKKNHNQRTEQKFSKEEITKISTMRNKMLMLAL